ncbi:MAG: hypothetical protein RR630_02380 [Coprobacillus sp.]
MLKENDIHQFLVSNQINYLEKSSICGVIFPNKTTYLLGPIAASMSLQYYILHFNKEGIAIMGLNNVTGKIEEQTLVFIQNSEIESIQFTKKLMAYNLDISTSHGNISYKVNKVMIGAGWHKYNLTQILNKYL